MLQNIGMAGRSAQSRETRKRW